MAKTRPKHFLKAMTWPSPEVLLAIGSVAQWMLVRPVGFIVDQAIPGSGRCFFSLEAVNKSLNTECFGSKIMEKG